MTEHVAETAFPSLDGTGLRGTLVRPGVRADRVVVLVHGGGVTRDEGGFFTRVAEGLARQGVASLRFDFRAHGESEGDQKDLTLAGVVNDIRAAVDHATETTGVPSASVLGASFGGGLAATFASRFPGQVRSLVLLNPLLNYKRRLIEEKPYWADDRIDPDTARALAENGFVEHSPTFRLGRPLLNELFFFRPHEEIRNVTAPTLVIHGTADTFISIGSSREAVGLIPGPTRLIEVEGAQHGIAAHDDPGYVDPRTRSWQAQAIVDIADWVTTR